MSRTPSQQSLARRAVVDPTADRSGWASRGVAVLGVSVLGLGIAGSVAMSSAQTTTDAQSLPITAAAAPAPSVSASAVPGVALPSAFDRRSSSLSRAANRPALAAGVVSGSSDRRDLGLLVATGAAQHTAQTKALELRDQTLSTIADATDQQDRSLRQARAKAEKAAKAAKKAKARAEKLAEARADKARADKAAEAKKAARAHAAEKSEKQSKKDQARKEQPKKERPGRSSGSGSASLPITSGYHIAARFGDTGSWSRYHTGIDFAAGMGTTIHAVASGTVTHAGSGSAGWAGRYVTIRHSDGKTSLYAHMSTVSVHQGEHVSGGEKVGAVGMTGRTFGPHVHFEIYPAGAKVGSPYQAINPAPWLRARGLHF